MAAKIRHLRAFEQERANVDALYDRALAAGYQPATVPHDAAWGERFFHLIDPDGHELSFARPLLPASGQ